MCVFVLLCVGVFVRGLCLEFVVLTLRILTLACLAVVPRKGGSPSGGLVHELLPPSPLGHVASDVVLGSQVQFTSVSGRLSCGFPDVEPICPFFRIVRSSCSPAVKEPRSVRLQHPGALRAVFLSAAPPVSEPCLQALWDLCSVCKSVCWSCE